MTKPAEAKLSAEEDLQGSVRALGWLNFFLADIQTGVGPFLAAYLAAKHWDARARMRGKGHFNLAQGTLATCVGLGAALSNTYGGMLAHRFGFAISFLGLGAVALLAFVILWTGVPETLQRAA